MTNIARHRARLHQYENDCRSYYGEQRDRMCRCGHRESEHKIGDFEVLGCEHQDCQCLKFDPIEPLGRAA